MEGKGGLMSCSDILLVEWGTKVFIRVSDHGLRITDHPQGSILNFNTVRCLIRGSLVMMVGTGRYVCWLVAGRVSFWWAARLRN